MRVVKDAKETIFYRHCEARSTNFLGEKLNVPCAARRVNHMEVIHNLLTMCAVSRDFFVPRNDEILLLVPFFALFASFAAKTPFV